MLCYALHDGELCIVYERYCCSMAIELQPCYACLVITLTACLSACLLLWRLIGYAWISRGCVPGGIPQPRQPRLDRELLEVSWIYPYIYILAILACARVSVSL